MLSNYITSHTVSFYMRVLSSVSLMPSCVSHHFNKHTLLPASSATATTPNAPGPKPGSRPVAPPSSWRPVRTRWSRARKPGGSVRPTPSAPRPWSTTTSCATRCFAESGARIGAGTVSRFCGDKSERPSSERAGAVRTNGSKSSSARISSAIWRTYVRRKKRLSPRRVRLKKRMRWRWMKRRRRTGMAEIGIVVRL